MVMCVYIYIDSQMGALCVFFCVFSLGFWKVGINIFWLFRLQMEYIRQPKNENSGTFGM